MDRYGLIGHPIGHSLSPRLFKAAYNGKHPYDLIETSDFEKAWKRFLDGYRAINVTAPFKTDAFARADWKSPECERCGATNLCLNTPEGVKAYNSDYMAVEAILRETGGRSVAVIGFGGAGKSALAAAEQLGLQTSLYRHAELADRKVCADVVVYTLPRAVEGIEKIECAHLLEANYKDPCMAWHEGYIPGTRWHLFQAVLGYTIMTGEQPDAEAMRRAYP